MKNSSKDIYKSVGMKNDNFCYTQLNTTSWILNDMFANTCTSEHVQIPKKSEMKNALIFTMGIFRKSRHFWKSGVTLTSIIEWEFSAIVSLSQAII